MDTWMEEGMKQMQLTESSTTLEAVIGIPGLLEKILMEFQTPELLTVRSVNGAWNNSALRLLKKRNDLTVHLTTTTLTENDPRCFLKEERSKFFLRRVSLDLSLKDEWRVRMKLHHFLEQHEHDITHMEVTTPDFLRDVWNAFRFPRLESLVLHETFDFGPVPEFVEEKPWVKKLSLFQEDSGTLNNLLMGATPRLQELSLLMDTTVNFSSLKSRSLRILDATLRASDAPEGVNALLHSKCSEGLETLKICFDPYYDYLNPESSGELVFKTAMPRLRNLSISFDTTWPTVCLKNFAPSLLPNLESISLDLAILEENSLAGQTGRFEQLRVLSITVVDFDEIEGKKLEKLLSLCEAAEVVKVFVYKLPIGPLPSGSLSVVNKGLLKSLSFFENLKELEMCVGFDFDTNEEGVLICSNLEDIEEEMMRIKSLAANGLERLNLEVTRRIKNSRIPKPYYYIEDWGQNFCCELLNLAKMLKSILIEGYGSAHLFCPALEERMRQAIAEDKLPLDVKWMREEERV